MAEKITEHQYNFVLLPVGRININHMYQRDAVQSLIKNIISNFDYHKVNPIKCVYRDGSYYAFDGQNTTLALTMLFGAKYKAPVMIYDDIGSPDEEAKLFEEINQKSYRKATTIADEIKSKLFREEPVATAIRKIARSVGTDIACGETKGKSGYIPASLFKTLEYIYENEGSPILTEVLSIICGAWKFDKYAYKPQIIKGLVVFVKAYPDMYNKHSLIDRLNAVDGGARSVYMTWQLSIDKSVKIIAREILAIYNKRTSVNRLPDRI